MATIVLDVPIKLKLRACRLHEYDREKAVKYFEKLGFRSIVKRLPSEDWEEEVEEVSEEKEEKKEDNSNQMGLF